MSETTKKTTAATGSKRSRATAKTVDKSATEQAPQTEPNAVVVQDGVEQVADNKPNESTPVIPVTGEADKPEQPTATNADSEAKGEEDEGQRSKEFAPADSNVSTDDGGADGSENSSGNSVGSDVPPMDSVNDPYTEQRDDVALVGVSGAFEVTAKSDAGFWRSGVKFHRLEKTLVLVAKEGVEDIKGIDQLGYKSDRVVCLSAENAKRIHSEQNLVVTDLDFDELVQSSQHA